jgi:hypothetical protein
MAKDPDDPSWAVDWVRLAQMAAVIAFSYWLYGAVRDLL